MLFRRDNGCFLNEKYIKFKPKMTKNPKFSKFQSFYAIFVKFSTDFVDWNVENAQRDRNGRNSLSSMLFRRDNGCFLNEKYIKFKPKMTKNPKFSKFQSFYAIFVKFSTDFVDWNVGKSQQGTNLLSSSLFRRDLGRKISRWFAGVLLNIYFRNSFFHLFGYSI